MKTLNEMEVNAKRKIKTELLLKLREVKDCGSLWC